MAPEDVIGAWTLESWKLYYSDGRDATWPLGADAEGLITYTSNGWMSAILQRAGRGPLSAPYLPDVPDSEKASLFDSLVVYAGPWTLSGDVLIHDVRLALNPDIIGSKFKRIARRDGNVLHLGGEEPPTKDGLIRRHAVVWRFASSLQGKELESKKKGG